VLVDEGYLGILRLRRIREDATERQGGDKQHTENAFHGAPILRLAVAGPFRGICDRRHFLSTPSHPGYTCSAYPSTLAGS
jgi:hypothetical protein